MKNVVALTEDGAFALFFRPHPGGFDSSRVPTPGNLPSKAKKMLMAGDQPGWVLAQVELTGVLFSIHFTAICLAIFVSDLCARLNSKIVSYCLTDISPVTYPDKGWTTSLIKMPMCTKAEMNEHITRSG